MKIDKCLPDDIALKSTFLGPQAENSDWVKSEINKILHRWFIWRRQTYPLDGRAISDENQSLPQFKERQKLYDVALNELVTRFENELPKFSPRYVGHMLSEIALPALFGHFVTLLHNPNNISSEASRVGVQLEDEAISFLLSMVGYKKRGIGHFTSGGTIANFEALLRARERSSLWLSKSALATQSERKDFFTWAHQGWDQFLSNPATPLSADDKARMRISNYSEHDPWNAARNLCKSFSKDFHGPIVLVPENKHYSWQKAVTMMGLGKESYWPVALDENGHLCINSLKKQIDLAAREDRPILAIISVLGTTELASFDPIFAIQDLLNQYGKREGWHFWHHIDAAYGGFFATLKGSLELESILTPAMVKSINAIPQSQSITLDPHKLGYVPYACGAILIKDRRDDIVQEHGAHYIDFEKSHDRGPYTLEGSRSAAGAAATWMIAKCVGLNENGYGRILHRTIHIKQVLEKHLLKSGLPIAIAHGTDSNILCFHVPAKSVSMGNEITQRLFNELIEGKKIYVSKTSLQYESYGKYIDKFMTSWNPEKDTHELLLIRMCLMNPFLNSEEMSIDYFSEFTSILGSALRKITT